MAIKRPAIFRALPETLHLRSVLCDVARGECNLLPRTAATFSRSSPYRICFQARHCQYSLSRGTDACCKNTRGSRGLPISLFDMLDCLPRMTGHILCSLPLLNFAVAQIVDDCSRPSRSNARESLSATTFLQWVLKMRHLRLSTLMPYCLLGL